MIKPRYRRDVQEQLAEALLLLNQTSLKLALIGLNHLPTTCPKPTQQKLPLWLRVLGHNRYDQVTLGRSLLRPQR